jgi:protocadherin Fat 4
MTVEDTVVADGAWHNVTLTSKFRTLRLFLDDVEVGDELDMSIVHDFMDPYLTSIIIGAANNDVFNINTNVFGKRLFIEII